MKVTVNGRTYSPIRPPDCSLLDWLREDLGLVGAKNGCDKKGACGACTVIVNGTAVRSCQVKLGTLDGAQVETIEGLKGNPLHPLQEAFVQAGAVQCGFCTPGMILTAKALLDRTPTPTRAEIKRSLRGNLCRCTGYAKIVDAVELGAAMIRSGASAVSQAERADPPYGVYEKVTGRLRFAGDLPPTGALVGKIVWAEHAHASIVAVDTTAALRLHGVVAVFTARDVPGSPTHGLIDQDQPVLCTDRVRYLGDAVALVVAEDETSAAEGCAAVRVKYETMPTVVDPEEALTAGAPPLFPAGNLACKYQFQRGEPDEAMQRAAVTVSGVFRTPAIEHAYLEPEAGAAYYEDGRVVVVSASQYPHVMRREIARILGVHETRVRVIAGPTGGAFGGKTDISIQALLALAAWSTRRRVRIALSREESLRTSVKRHPMSLSYRIGVDSAGQIMGLEADILADCGAYQSLSKPLLEQTAAFSSGPYRILNAKVRVRGAFTNSPPSSAMRGFGIPQPTFALESLLDEVARHLELNPIELRRRNALRPGDVSVTGQRMGRDTHLIEVLDLLEDVYKKEKAEPIPAKGVGIACGYKNVGLGLGEDDFAEVVLEALPSGGITVYTGAVDLGQGVSTVLAKLASRELGVPYDSVRVEYGDTDRTPDARETNASRQSVMSGNALLRAVAELKRVAVEKAREVAPELQPPLVFNGAAIADAQGATLTIGEVAGRAIEAGSTLVASGRYTAPTTFPLTSDPAVHDQSHYFAYTFFANLAVVRVAPDTGKVAVERVVAAYDVGKVLHRQGIEGQVEGAAVMGMGYALSEEYKATGPSMTTSLAQCGLIHCPDVPEIVSLFVEAEDSLGPYGAKGVGEVAMIATAPAITNAIRDATGARVFTLPARPARVREAQQARGAGGI